MEKTTKHRIFGILIVIGLVIVLLPLFQTEKVSPIETSLMNSPPFPGQSTPADSNVQPDNSLQANNGFVQPDNNASSDIKPRLINDPIPIQNGSQDDGVNQQPDDTINLNRQSAANPTVPAIDNGHPNAAAKTPQNNAPEEPSAADNAAESLANSPDITGIDDQNQDKVATPKNAANPPPNPDNVFRNSLEEDISKEKDIKSKMAKAEKPEINAKKIARNESKKTQRIALKQTPLDNDGLFKLKSSAWVIQMGSFRNKTNALRLVNRLRAKGYHAFIQDMASNTSVFVGPELKQNSARELASQLQDEMHIQGFVISYRPLTL